MIYVEYNIAPGPNKNHYVLRVQIAGAYQAFIIRIAAPEDLAEIVYWTHRYTSIAIRDWLYAHRGEFGPVEHKFEKILFTRRNIKL